MSIIRFTKGKKNPYFLMHNSTVNDQRLSFKAKGFLAYILSKPDHWYVNYNDLVSASTDGLFSVRSTIKELITASYLVRSQLRSNNGQFGFYDFTIYEKPQLPKSFKNRIAPYIGKRHTVKPHTVNRTLIITDITPITEEDKTTTTSEVLPGNAAAAAISFQNKKTEILHLLSSLKIGSHKIILDNYSLDDILKYSTRIKEKNKQPENPTGFFITAIKEKWLDDIIEEPDKREELYWWYDCPRCKIQFGRLYETDEKIHCSKCDLIIKSEERQSYLKKLKETK